MLVAFCWLWLWLLGPQNGCGKRKVLNKPAEWQTKNFSGHFTGFIKTTAWNPQETSAWETWLVGSVRAFRVMFFPLLMLITINTWVHLSRIGPDLAMWATGLPCPPPIPSSLQPYPSLKKSLAMSHYRDNCSQTHHSCVLRRGCRDVLQWGPPSHPVLMMWLPLPRMQCGPAQPAVHRQAPVMWWQRAPFLHSHIWPQSRP